MCIISLRHKDQKLKSLRSLQVVVNMVKWLIIISVKVQMVRSR